MILSVHTGETASSVEYHIHSVVSPEFRIEGDAKVVKFPGSQLQINSQFYFNGMNRCVGWEGRVHSAPPADEQFHLLTGSINWLKS